MRITDADIILEYQCAKRAKKKFDAAERLIRRMDGEIVTESNQNDDEEFLYQCLEVRNMSREELQALCRQTQLSHNSHLAQANELRARRDKQDEKTFFGRLRIKRRNKERKRYLAKKMRQQA